MPGLQRPYLIIAVGNRTLMRCARSIRRNLTGVPSAFIGVQTDRANGLTAFAKPFGTRAWRDTAPSPIPDELLDRMVEAAVSIRNQLLLRSGPGGEHSDMSWDLVVLVDMTDSQCAEPYSAVLSRLAEQAVLRPTPNAALRLQVLFEGPRGGEIPQALSDVLAEQSVPPAGFLNHTILFQSSNVDHLTVPGPDRADAAGRAIGVLLRLDWNHPARAMLRPLPIHISRRMVFWSVGFAEMDVSREGFLETIRHCYAEYLAQLWLRRTMRRM